MTKLIIYLREEEFSALSNLAQREYRVTKAQASLIIRTELERLGLLPSSERPFNARTPESLAESHSGD